jgi:hypothetical protein
VRTDRSGTSAAEFASGLARAVCTAGVAAQAGAGRLWHAGGLLGSWGWPSGILGMAVRGRPSASPSLRCQSACQSTSSRVLAIVIGRPRAEPEWLWSHPLTVGGAFLASVAREREGAPSATWSVARAAHRRDIPWDCQASLLGPEKLRTKPAMGS